MIGNSQFCTAFPLVKCLGDAFFELYILASSTKYTHKLKDTKILHFKSNYQNINIKGSFLSNKCGTSCWMVFGNLQQWVHRFPLKTFVTTLNST